MEGVHDRVGKIVWLCLTRPVSRVEQLRTKVTSSVLSVNFMERAENLGVITINTLVYFDDPEGVLVNEGVRMLKSDGDWNVDNLLFELY